MSTILRALKKLEHDKTSHTSEPEDLDLEFLSTPPPAPRRSPMIGLLMVGLLLACGSTATYLFMARTEKAPPPASAPLQARQAALNVVTSVAPSVAPLANRSSAAAQPAVPTAPVQPPQKPVPAASGVEPQKSAPKVPTEVLTRQNPVITKPHTAKAPRLPAQVSSTLSLTVNGIVLSDGEKRKAIVNGMSVSVGSVIEGARVEDIQSNRVKFRHGGESFEVSVGNTGP